MHEVVGAPEGHGGPEENLFLIPVAVTLSIPAVLVCHPNLLGHRAASEEILLPTEASDQWAYFMKWKARRRYLAHCLRPNKEKLRPSARST